MKNTQNNEQSFTVVNACDGLMHIHKAGCRNSLSTHEAGAHGTRQNGRYDVVATDAEKVAADEMDDLNAEIGGFTEHDFVIHGCAK